MSKKIELKLLPNGEIHIETLGIKGKKCLDYIDIINKIIGARTVKIDKTKEYYESEEYLLNNENIKKQNIQIDD